jgi:GNAT superfamily N-acetyltransferase
VTYSIREATLVDQPRLRVLGRHFRNNSLYRDIFGQGDRMDELVVRVLEHGVIFVGEAGGSIQGLLAIVLAEHFLTGAPYADEVAWWVEPAHRRTSLAGRLLHHMERWAVDQGLDFVKMVAPEDAEGHHLGDFYRRAGYVPVETCYLKRLSDGRVHGTSDRRGDRIPGGEAPQEEAGSDAGSRRRDDADPGSTGGGDEAA